MKFVVIFGDGIGLEVMEEVMKVFLVVVKLEGFIFEWIDFDFGGECYLCMGEIFLEGVVEELWVYDVIFLGVIGYFDVVFGIFEKGLLLEFWF